MKKIMKKITLVKNRETWDLYQDEETGRLYIYDSEPRYGGYWKMFESLEEAEKDGWEKEK